MLGLALLAQLAMVAHGPDTASACMPIRLTAAIRTPGAAVPRIRVPDGAGIQLLRSSVTSRGERDGFGALFTITEVSAEVATASTGRVQVPPFAAEVGGSIVTSSPVTVGVHPAVAAPALVLVRAALDDGSGGAVRDSLVVGQQVDYRVDVLLNETARSRLRRNPQFFPPEMASALAYDLPVPMTMSRQGTRCFETMTYRRALFPLFPGELSIPPALLTYSLPHSTSFFSREEHHEVRTERVRLVALEPPLGGRPAGYSGAVGDLRISTRVPSPRARMGDPVVLTVRVEGAGNVKLLPRPSISVSWADVALEDERVTVDSTSLRIRGAKEFDWLLTPRVAGAQTIPPVRYPVYEPAARRYVVLESAPIVLDVAAAALATADTAGAAPLPIRAVMGTERAPPVSSRWSYWLLLALAPVPATLRGLARRRGSRTRQVSAAEQLRALAAARSAPSPREVRRLFLDGLRERVPAVGRDRDALGWVLRRAGVGDGTAIEADAMLVRLDDAAFSASGTLDPRSVREASEIVDLVHREAVPPAARGVGVLGAGALVLLLTAAAHAAGIEAERSFADGVQAYRRGQFSLAQRRFERAAAGAPRAGDAWANAGASAWQAGDSANAARAWHQALRLDPLDVETRERLGSVQRLGATAPAFVPPVPMNALAAGVLVLWCVGWLLVALPHAWRPSAARPLAGGAIVIALAGAAALVALGDRLSARDLAVLASSRPLLEAPIPSAPSVGMVGAGEAGRIGPSEGEWVRIALDDARVGWVPASAVLPLELVQSSRLTALTPPR